MVKKTLQLTAPSASTMMESKPSPEAPDSTKKKNKKKKKKNKSAADEDGKEKSIKGDLDALFKKNKKSKPI